MSDVRIEIVAVAAMLVLAIGVPTASAQEAGSIDQRDTTSTTAGVGDVEAMLAAATAAYDAGQYDQSARLYEAVAATSGTSAALYYDLGGAYYKQGQWARAILNYERCLLVEPSNADARANLELARLNTVDKIETIQPIIFVRWSQTVRDWLSERVWSVLSVALFLSFLACLALYFFGRHTVVRKTGFYLGLVALVMSLVAMHYGSAQRDRLAVRDYAIVMQPTVTVRSSPAESGTQLFTLHEGTKVRVRQTIGEWSEVALSDGNVGWLPTAAVELI